MPSQPLQARCGHAASWIPIGMRASLLLLLGSTVPACSFASHEPLADVLVRTLDFTPGAATKHARTLYRQLPRCVTRELTAESVGSTACALQQRLGLSDSELQTVVARRPSLLGMDYEESLSPTISGLARRLELDETELRTLAVRLPAVMGVSFERSQRPKLDFLQESLSLTPAELKEWVLSAPIALCLASLEMTLRHNVDMWVRELLADGLEPKESLERCGGLILLVYNHRRWARPRVAAARRAGVPTAEHALRALPKHDDDFAAWLASARSD